MPTHAQVIDAINKVAKHLGGAIRAHAQPRHRPYLDNYARLMLWLVKYVTKLENKMSQISQALSKVEGQRDAWKSYAQQQSDRAKAAEDKLAAIPFIPDADDNAAVTAVLDAPDDLPPVPQPTDAGVTPPIADNTSATQP